MRADPVSVGYSQGPANDFSEHNRPTRLGNHRGMRVLLIDDEINWLDSLALLLRGEGYIVETATQGQAGLERLGQGGIDLLILDLLMPEMGGAEVLAEISEDPLRPVVIIASGSDDATYVTSALLQGADEYIRKPCSLQELLIRIANACHKRELLRMHLANQNTLKEMAWTDTITQLPNRRYLEHELEMRMARAHRSGGKVAILFIDLDHFKQVNDHFGHDAGDSLLAQVSRRLESVLRKYDFLARYGGDELVLLLSEEDAVSVSARIARKVVHLLRRPFQLNGSQVNVSVSIGVSLFPDSGQDMRTLLKHADSAMYQVKENGRNGFSMHQMQP